MNNLIIDSGVLLMSFSAFGLLALRLALGAIFIVHGRAKFSFWKSDPNTPPNPMSNMMKFLSIAETLGAIALILGFLTQWAAIGLAIIMAGAIHMKGAKWKVPFWSQNNTGWEFDLMNLAACIALATMGAGLYSLDRIIFGL